MTSTAYFDAKLAHETDPSDVYADQKAGLDFVLVDVRSVEAWQQGHIRGALHMPYRDIEQRAPQDILRSTPVVVYCWSPGCNAGAKGARGFAKLGYAVKEMIGGYEYWAREGQPTEDSNGDLPRIFDPLVMLVRDGKG
ncbi:rhodanese-related sulfurtransferase [Microbacterium halimionae]|uniref:Rhodanese-related sulfurtransferase n=1 Tax=Microbacterium halimionae TaxID=1526413 RepID=A0A7W3JNT9_9MICO|nr:rhodanese-like domain-containing protein [Microbacterium halimionae]MBA8816279.1 rhodanese-related sulfurtransferase [Microbacterium halimionae]NII96482.1 rhodanese-related sulfurtransferase [Microbacterium halimionae]